MASSGEVTPDQQSAAVAKLRDAGVPAVADVDAAMRGSPAS
jgi:hypothetical protein